VAEGLGVSFQRYPYPPSGTINALPRSCGALPILRGGPDELLVPCPAGEALWIGLVRSPGIDAAWQVRVVTTTGAPVPVEALVDVPPAVAVPGLPRGDGTWWALAREAAPGYPGFELRVSSSSGSATSVRVELLSARDYESISGAPLEPLDTGSAYGGWRLP
jgi:hypothetical protein